MDVNGVFLLIQHGGELIGINTGTAIAIKIISEVEILDLHTVDDHLGWTE